MATKKSEKEAIAQTEELFEKIESLTTQDFQGAGSVTFLCPRCGKGKIRRTHHERKIATKYHCSSCGFEGPN